MISDGKHYQQSMLATQLNELVTSNQVQENSLVRLKVRDNAVRRMWGMVMG